MQTEHLTKSELRILSFLGEERTSKDIQKEMGITQAAYHVHTCNIRSKTRLRNLHNPAACQDFLRNYGDGSTAGATHEQKRVLALWADGYSYEDIARKLDSTPAKVRRIARQGASNMGIHQRGAKRLANIKYILLRDSVADASPLNDPAFN